MTIYGSLHSLPDCERLLFYCDQWRTTNHYLHVETLLNSLRLNWDSFVIPGGPNIGHHLEELVVILLLSRECLC
jgi:hypothetical protein